MFVADHHWNIAGQLHCLIRSEKPVPALPSAARRSNEFHHACVVSISCTGQCEIGGAIANMKCIFGGKIGQIRFSVSMKVSL